MSDTLTPNVIRYGREADLPGLRTLRAGPVTAVLENADLRYVRFGDTQVVLRLYVAVRNRNWDTIEPVFSDFTVDDQGDSFRITFTAEHVAGDVDFVWSGRIDGAADGTIRYEMDGAPRKPFLRNRIGFCILHPMTLAGLPVIVETPDGQIESDFPERISPNQPFIDMRSISHAAGTDGHVTIRFEGDLFEAEDQRNWTDASYKTYSTPLRLPYPVEVTPDDRIAQTVTMSFTGAPALSAAADSHVDVSIDLENLTPLPEIGFGAGTKPVDASDDVERLRALGANHLWTDLDLGSMDWRERLAVAAANAYTLGVPLELSVIGESDEAGWDELAGAVCALEEVVQRIYVFPPPVVPMVFPRTDLVTDPATLAAAKHAFGSSDIAIGGGARTFFTELNRGEDAIPFEDLAAVTYPMNPTVHAMDNLSVIETLAAQGVTVESARVLAGDRPLAIGPITFRMQSNPNATEPATEAAPDQLPDSVDPRQLSLLGAGWTLGSIHRLGAAGADSLTYFELLGWRGLIEQKDGLTRRDLFPSIPGGLFPLYHIFAAVASMSGGELATVTLNDELAIETLALRNGDQVMILVANLTNDRRTVQLDVPGIRDATVRILDEQTYADAVNDPGFFSSDGDAIAVEPGIQLPLGPFAIACFRGTC